VRGFLYGISGEGKTIWFFLAWYRVSWGEKKGLDWDKGTSPQLRVSLD